jgi:hypothetical protein
MTNTKVGFHESLLKRKLEADEFRSIIFDAIVELGQPVTVAEVQAHVGYELNREFNQARIRYAFDALVVEGKLVHRKETPEERTLRFNGRQPMAGAAQLYYPAHISGRVPARTVVSVVAGVELTGPLKRRGRIPGTRNKTVKAQPRVRTSRDGFSGLAFDHLVEKLVEARHVELIKENTSLRAQLAEIRKLIS